MYDTFRYTTDDNKITLIRFARRMIRATNTQIYSIIISFSG